MAIPDFQTLMRPLLEEYATGEERRIADVRAALAKRFDLSEDELAQRIPSGYAKTFDNRVGWAVSHLFRVGLLARPHRSIYAITERGEDVLGANSHRVDLGVLSQFPELAEFRQPSGDPKPAPAGETGGIETDTPEERIGAAYQELRGALVADLRDRIASMTSATFEGLVLHILHTMGYGDGTDDSVQHTGRSGDAGIDGVIRQDALGLDSIYVQAKRWNGTVGRPEVQGFVGALQGQRASKGIVFAASTFSPEAREYAATVSPRVVLIDGEQLADLMISHNIGVSERETFVVERVDGDFFGDET